MPTAGAYQTGRTEWVGVNGEAAGLKREVGTELQDAQATFHRLLESMSEDDLRQPTSGTKWNNEELLFHMLFGYLIASWLIRIVIIFGHLPWRVGRLFAMLLNGLTVPFNMVNYLGSRLGARIVNHKRMGARFDKVCRSLSRRLAAEPGHHLWLAMAFPTRWDPFFKGRMTLADTYHYPYQHFMFHRRQLTAGSDGQGN
jgi:hypothetical protein